MDAKGSDELGYPQFHISMFQIADMWCGGVDAQEYVSLLEIVLDAVSVQGGTMPNRREYRDMDRTPYSSSLCFQNAPTHRLRVVPR